MYVQCIAIVDFVCIVVVFGTPICVVLGTHTTAFVPPSPPPQVGLRELHDLWDVDEVALGNSEPRDLAFAIICLSKRGPPPQV